MLIETSMDGLEWCVVKVIWPSRTKDGPIKDLLDVLGRDGQKNSNPIILEEIVANQPTCELLCLLSTTNWLHIFRESHKEAAVPSSYART